MRLMAGTSGGLSIAFAIRPVIRPVRAERLANIHRAGKLPVTIARGVAGFSFTPSVEGLAGPDSTAAHTALLNARTANRIPAALSIPPKREQSIAQP